MDLYVCGPSHLLRQEPCRKYALDTSNRCPHVPSGRIGCDEVCPLVPTTPKLVERGLDTIELRTTDAEHIVQLQNSAGPQYRHTRDGYDRTLEETSIAALGQHVRDEDIQDLWQWQEYDDLEDIFADDLAEYPRGRPTRMGSLARDGGIYCFEQQPFRIRELTLAGTRRGLSHALIRTECHNGAGDTWPEVVLPGQPDVVYRFPTTADLLAWLRGEKVAARTLRLPGRVARLFDGRWRNCYCYALLDFHEVYYWGRASAVGVVEDMTIEEALNRSAESLNVEVPVITNEAGARRYREYALENLPSDWNTYDPIAEHTYVSATGAFAPFAKLDLPPISTIDLGEACGAAITKDTGTLYLFTTRSNINSAHDRHTPHLLDLDDHGGFPDPKIAPAFAPRRASINDRLCPNGTAPVFVDVAVGNKHIVALTADGRVFAAGSGAQGELGIGGGMFTLDDEDYKGFEWSHDCPNYAEEWHEVRVPGTGIVDGRERQVVKIAAGDVSTIFVMGPKGCGRGVAA